MLSLLPDVDSVAMSTALVYWQSMNASMAGHEPGLIGSSTGTMTAAAPPAVAVGATISASSAWRPSWSNWSNGENGNGYQLQQQQPPHYLAQIDCQHTIKSFASNPSSRFRATISISSSNDSSHHQHQHHLLSQRPAQYSCKHEI